MYTNKFYLHQGIKSIELADKVILLSHEQRKSFIDQGVSEEKMTVVNLGLLQKFDNCYSVHKQNAFICTASHSFVKGTHNLLLAWQAAKIETMPLIVVGHVQEDIAEFIQRHGPFENVVFAGRQHIAEFYRQYNGVGILVSLAEGCPRVVPEYLCNGFPVIVTPCATCDMVEHGENGYIVDYNDVDAIVKYLQAFSLNPALIETMGKSAASSVAHMDLDHYADGVLDVLMATAAE